MSNKLCGKEINMCKDLESSTSIYLVRYRISFF